MNKEEFQQKMRQVGQKVKTEAKEALEYVDENPRKVALMSVVVGAAVGAVVALLLGRRK